MTTDFKTMLAEAKLPERTVPICLRGDLVADFEAAERELQAAQSGPDTSSLEGSAALVVVERMEALQTQMREHTYLFRVRALPRPKFKQLVADHGPRKDPETGDVDERDKYVGVNVDEFFPLLIRACVVDPVLDEDTWAELLDEKLTDKQFDALQNAAWFINRNDVDVPFSLAASRIRRSSEPE